MKRFITVAETVASRLDLNMQRVAMHHINRALIVCSLITSRLQTVVDKLAVCSKVQKLLRCTMAIACIYEQMHQTVFKHQCCPCRGVKKDDKQRDQRRVALGLHDAVKLLPESSADAQAASFVRFGDSRAFTKNWQKKRKAVVASSIFSPAAVAAAKKKEAPLPLQRQ